MPRRYANPQPHPALAPRSKNSHVEIEQLTDGSFAYRLNGGPRRVVPPGPYGLYNVLRQLDAIIQIEPTSSQDVAELARLERELHEDLIEYEFQRIERENARLYAGSYVPSRACEPGRKITTTIATRRFASFRAGRPPVGASDVPWS